MYFSLAFLLDSCIILLSGCATDGSWEYPGGTQREELPTVWAPFWGTRRLFLWFISKG